MYIILQDDYEIIADTSTMFKVLDTKDLVCEFLSYEQLLNAIDKLGVDKFANIDAKWYHESHAINLLDDEIAVNSFVYWFDTVSKWLKESDYSLTGNSCAFHFYNKRNRRGIFIYSDQYGLYFNKERIVEFKDKSNVMDTFDISTFQCCIASICNLGKGIFRLTFETSVYYHVLSPLYRGNGEEDITYSHFYVFVSMKDGKVVGVGHHRDAVVDFNGGIVIPYKKGAVLLQDDNLYGAVDVVQDSPEQRTFNALRAMWKLLNEGKLLHEKLLD